MLRGPKGENRSANVIAGVHIVFRVPVGEDTDDIPSGRRRSGLAGAAAKANVLSSADRNTTAKNAASTRWDKELSKGAK